jgi:NAD(P)-dependent dehydrogenase (short-subunit alcohol dehydrogenase family)
MQLASRGNSDRLLPILSTSRRAKRQKVMNDMRDLQGDVVVVTGASGGLGREAAVQFAAAGSIVIVAARREADLEETVRLCRAAGGQAFHCVTDVTEEAQVANLAAFALSKTGRLGVWVNNAGATLFGALESGAFEEHRRVIEVNVYGAVFAARAVLPIFRRQGSGVMINIGSILSKIGQPFVPSYVISKFALHGLTEALRAEVASDTDIHICSLFPYAVDTPHFQSGANLVGRDAHAMPPVQSPEKVARAIVDLARRPRHERYVPRAAVLGLALHALMPRTVERVIHDALVRWHFGDQPEQTTTGNLFWPSSERGAVHGQRPPRLSGSSLLVWALVRFGWIQIQTVKESLRRLRGPAGQQWAAARRRIPVRAGARQRSPELS